MILKLVRLIAFFFLLVVFNGCLMHFFNNSTLRLQIINRSEENVTEIISYSPDSSWEERILFDDEVESGGKSRVFEVDWSGSLYLRVGFAPDGCEGDPACERFVDFGQKHLGEGSVRLIFQGESPDLRVEN